MPNPRFNKLTKPVKLPSYMFEIMYLHVYWYISMYGDYKNYGIKPWELNKNHKILTSDIRCLEMMDQLLADVKEMERRMSVVADQTKQDIQEQYGMQEQNTTRPRRKKIFRRQ